MTDERTVDGRWRVAEVVCAEVIGTALLVFFVCMSQINFFPENPLPPLQAAIMTAVVVATVVQVGGQRVGGKVLSGNQEKGIGQGVTSQLSNIGETDRHIVSDKSRLY